ncbi:uncharacterized protein DSM5745_04747 [Aspergillus mulundensis]|uniref:Uncharacterized protein n=1 Tax=Aspergillus mulundensis TaxID=1810919 RepID=A0A3D8S4R4_9EURO|nr:hypothetical protein DSM5745_04747 [Aspergillus mulundensis]RDW81190.1 hypothetical protein DSM5745_04747 [Aspergillus mulundensis]
MVRADTDKSKDQDIRFLKSASVSGRIVTGFDMEVQELEQIAQLHMGLHFNDPETYLPGRPVRLFA